MFDAVLHVLPLFNVFSVSCVDAVRPVLRFRLCLHGACMFDVCVHALRFVMTSFF